MTVIVAYLIWLVMAIMTILGALSALFVFYAVLVLALFQDELRACFERDPAARNIFEVLLTYSGLQVVVAHRVAHGLDRMRIPILPRLIMGVARWLTGIEIHPGATIGRGLFIDHGTGVVVGETSVIGDNVTMYQGVTLGGTGKERGKRHPTIGNNVVIGTGAKVLGNIKVGDNSMIGANAVVLQEVPEHSTVVGVPGKVVRSKDEHVPGRLDHVHMPDPVADRLHALQREVHALEDLLKQKKAPDGK